MKLLILAPFLFFQLAGTPSAKPRLEGIFKVERITKKVSYQEVLLRRNKTSFTFECQNKQKLFAIGKSLWLKAVSFDRTSQKPTQLIIKVGNQKILVSQWNLTPDISKLSFSDLASQNPVL